MKTQKWGVVKFASGLLKTDSKNADVTGKIQLGTFYTGSVVALLGIVSGPIGWAIMGAGFALTLGGAGSLIYSSSKPEFSNGDHIPDLVIAGIADFKKNRGNGDDVRDSPVNLEGTGDGKVIWIKGRVENDYVLGIRKKDGGFEYELRYNAGTKDLAFFEAKDRNYLTRILKDGTLRIQEPAVWYLYESDSYPLDIGSWWHELLLRHHYYDREGTEEIDAVLAQAEKDEKAHGQKLLERNARQKALEEQKLEEGRKETERLRQQQSAAEKAHKDQEQKKQQEKEQKEHLAKEEAQKVKEEREAQRKREQEQADKEKKEDIGSYLIQYAELKFFDKKVDKELNKSSLDADKALGQGGFGIVYRGKWRYNEVAIKQLLIKNITPDSLQEFEKEMKIMARLHADNVVALRGCCLQPPCIVMEYMKGGSLFGLLHDHKQYPDITWSVRYRIVTDIAKGLAFLHESHILHRDLKSLNVLLDEHFQAKLTDFGLAKVKIETSSTTGGFKGTLRWAAPEYVQGEAYTPAADVYSMGYIFWEVVSRETPHKGTPEMAIPFRVCSGKRDEIPKDCPPKIASLIKFCWFQEPKSRPTASKVVDYLYSEEDDDFAKFVATK